MASLFEERALLDLVRGLKTLRGGWKGSTEGRWSLLSKPPPGVEEYLKDTAGIIVYF